VRAIEAAMQEYYRAARDLLRYGRRLCERCRPPSPGPAREPRRLDERFAIIDNRLVHREFETFVDSPVLALDALVLARDHGVELSGQTFDAIAETAALLSASANRGVAELASEPEAQRRFLDLLCGRDDVGTPTVLELCNELRLLERVVPEFGPIRGRMQHDSYHVYTVDQHILQVVRNVRRFMMVEHAHEYPLCSRLIADFERPWLLYVAAIFHDIAKGRGGDHSKLGQRDARRFCIAHDLAPEDVELVNFLVEHHLTMSTFAQKRDLADPAVIAEFARIVGTERRLIALYLLTVADIRGTSPKVWNAWKGKLLEDLLRAARAVLRGDSVGFDRDVQAKQAEAERLLRLYALSDDASKPLWRELDLAYFLRHGPQEIAWQTRHLHYRVTPEKPVVKARLSPIGEGIQVMVYCRDQPDLFARICGYFGQIGDNILDAKIHTTRHGYALDTFLVLSPPGSSPYREMSSLIEHDLAERLERHAPLPPPMNGRISRQLKHFPVTPEVHIRPDERGPYHVLSVTAGDRPGLLYAVARVLGEYHISLRTAKIVTLGERAEDVFVVTGAALQNERKMLQLENDLLAALQ
jgi:[protein-PII] uridylyltransferase